MLTTSANAEMIVIYRKTSKRCETNLSYVSDVRLPITAQIGIADA